MATTVTTEREGLGAAEPSQLLVTWNRFRRHKLALMGLITLFVMGLACIIGPMLTGYRSDFLDLSNRFGSPSAAHWLGTDELGRDLLTRLLEAGRISLAVGILITVIVLIIGSLVGCISGYYGGTVDSIMMRLVDLIISLPSLPLLLVLSAALRNVLPSFLTIVLVLSLLGWTGISRIVRGSILSLRNLDFVEATRALGAGTGRIMFAHLLPNSLAPLIVFATLSVGEVIIAESTLSFLGLGIQPPTPSWGNMLNAVQVYFLERPFMAFYPGLMILITVLAINFVGDALRDALDPRLKM
jgi:peptide/nickel transport system permease protein